MYHSSSLDMGGAYRLTTVTIHGQRTPAIASICSEIIS